MTSLAEEANNALVRLIYHAQYSVVFVHRELSHHHSDYLSTGSMHALDKSLECLWTLMQLYSVVNAVRLWWNRMHFQLMLFVDLPSFRADSARMQPILDQLLLRMKQQYDRLTNWIDHVAVFSDDQQLYDQEVFHRMEDVYEQFKDVFELLKDAGEDVAYEQALTVINAVILCNSGATREQLRNALLIRPSIRPTIPFPVNEGYFPRRCRRVLGIVRARVEAAIAETGIEILVGAETEIADEGGAAFADTGIAEEVQDASEVDFYCYEQLSSFDEGNDPNNDHEQGNNPNNDREQGNNVEYEDDDDGPAVDWTVSGLPIFW